MSQNYDTGVDLPNDGGTEVDKNTLVARVKRLEQRNDDFGEVAQRVENQSQIISNQQDEIEELKNELLAHREQSAKRRDELKQSIVNQQERIAEQSKMIDELKEDRETAGYSRVKIREEIHTLKESVEADSTDTTPNDDMQSAPTSTSTPTIREPQAALEDVIRVPEHLVEESLSANQQRARFVAKDIHQYSSKVPAGRALNSSELRKVLSARKQGCIHTETVGRVIDYLDDLGESSIKIRKRQDGERTVVFTDECVKRVVAYQNMNHDVVSEVTSNG
jgi:chromosome segregation ATPase